MWLVVSSRSATPRILRCLAPTALRSSPDGSLPDDRMPVARGRCLGCLGAACSVSSSRSIVRGLFRHAGRWPFCADRLVDRVPVGNGPRRLTAFLGGCPEKWAAGAGDLLLALLCGSPLSRSRRSHQSCSRRSATRCGDARLAPAHERFAQSMAQRIQWDPRS